MLDAQTLQRPPNLCRARAVDLAARNGRVKIMRAAIRVEAQRQTVRAEHFRQRAKRRVRSFLLDQERRVDRVRRIVQRHDQIKRRLPRKPHMP